MGNYFIVNGELYHHGVKGMKWGVRKDRKRSMSKLKTKDNIQKWGIRKDRKRSMSKLKTKDDIQKLAVNGRRFVNNNHFMNLSVRQANQFAMEQATRASINASLQAASLGMSGGMNPFMFGMM